MKPGTLAVVAALLLIADRVNGNAGGMYDCRALVEDAADLLAEAERFTKERAGSGTPRGPREPKK